VRHDLQGAHLRYRLEILLIATTSITITRTPIVQPHIPPHIQLPAWFIIEFSSSSVNSVRR